MAMQVRYTGKILKFRYDPTAHSGALDGQGREDGRPVFRAFFCRFDLLLQFSAIFSSIF